MGTEAEGIGLVGTLKVLKDTDASQMSSALAAQLDSSFSSIISIDIAMLNRKPLDEFKKAVASVPSYPAQLTGSLTKNLDVIKSLCSEDLPRSLLQSMDGLQSIQSLIPPDPRILLIDATDGLNQIKSELISGSFGMLRQWSESVQRAQAELSLILAGGAKFAEDGLISYINAKMAELAQLVFPPQQSSADTISAQLDQAISIERLAEIEAIKSELIIHMNNARIEFDNGNFTNTAHLALASGSFDRLSAELEDIRSKLQSALGQDISNSTGLTYALHKQFDDLEAIEIIDFGNIKDRFVEAIKSIDAVIKKLKLESVRENIEEVYNKINYTIEKFDLGNLSEGITDFQSRIQFILDSLDGALFKAVASIRNNFTQIKETLRSVASALGSYDQSDIFHFNVQQDIENLLNDIKKNLNDSIKPIIEGFETKVEDALQNVRIILNSVTEKIDPIKVELQTMLQGVIDSLNKLGVPGKMEETRGKLEKMFEQLAVIDFDPLLDPAIAQINEMRDQLKKIDSSMLNEFVLGSLESSAKAVKDTDFTNQVTGNLLAEFNDMLQAPKKALKDIEDIVESMTKKLSELEPDAILKPLEDIFDPLVKNLDELKLDKLVEPFDTQFNYALLELEKVSPAVLLKPLVDMFDKLKDSFDSISPEALVKPVQDIVDDLKLGLQKFDLQGTANSLVNEIDSVKKSIDEISPERLLTPLVNTFGKIEKALDSFNPGTLLEPLINIFDELMAPLNSLTPEHVRTIGEAFEPLKKASKSLDPRHNFQKMQEKIAQVQSLIQQLNVGMIIADLKGPYDSLKASFEAKGSPNVSIDGILEVMNPLRNETIGKTINGLQLIQTQLQDAFPEAEPPSELISRYEQAKPKLESLIPAWVKDDMTTASIKETIQRLNPVNFKDEINQLYEMIKQQFKSIRPQTIQENLKKSFDKIEDSVLALDPETLLSGLQGVMDNLHKKLDSFNLSIVVDESKGLFDEVDSMIMDLDPRLTIQHLEALNAEVKVLMTSIKPSEILKDLIEPFETAKKIVEEFNLDGFKEPLQEIFGKIEEILLIDEIGAILRLLDDRIEELEKDMEAGLKRTEAAFKNMVAAMPV